MPDSSKRAAAMASLTRWLTNDDNEEEDELNYAPLPHLLLFSSLSPPSPSQSSFSYLESSTFLAMAAAAALLFLRGSPLPASLRAAAWVP
jgi:hypothetical protein